MPVLPQAVLGLPRRESKLEIHKEKSSYDMMNYSQMFIAKKKGQLEKIMQLLCHLWTKKANDTQVKKRLLIEKDPFHNRPNPLTQSCVQFESPGVKVLCVLHWY